MTTMPIAFSLTGLNDARNTALDQGKNPDEAWDEGGKIVLTSILQTAGFKINPANLRANTALTVATGAVNGTTLSVDTVQQMAFNIAAAKLHIEPLRNPTTFITTANREPVKFTVSTNDPSTTVPKTILPGNPKLIVPSDAVTAKPTAKEAVTLPTGVIEPQPITPKTVRPQQQDVQPITRPADTKTTKTTTPGDLQTKPSTIDPSRTPNDMVSRPDIQSIRPYPDIVMSDTTPFDSSKISANFRDMLMGDLGLTGSPEVLDKLLDIKQSAVAQTKTQPLVVDPHQNIVAPNGRLLETMLTRSEAINSLDPKVGGRIHEVMKSLPVSDPSTGTNPSAGSKRNDAVAKAVLGVEPTKPLIPGEYRNIDSSDISGTIKADFGPNRTGVVKIGDSGGMKVNWVTSPKGEVIFIDATTGRASSRFNDITQGLPSNLTSGKIRVSAFAGDVPSSITINKSNVAEPTQKRTVFDGFDPNTKTAVMTALQELPTTVNGRPAWEGNCASYAGVVSKKIAGVDLQTVLQRGEWQPTSVDTVQEQISKIGPNRQGIIRTGDRGHQFNWVTDNQGKVIFIDASQGKVSNKLSSIISGLPANLVDGAITFRTFDLPVPSTTRPTTTATLRPIEPPIAGDPKTITQTSISASKKTTPGVTSDELAKLAKEVDDRALINGKGGSATTIGTLQAKINAGKQDQLLSVRAPDGRLSAVAAIGPDFIRTDRGQTFDGLKVDYLSNGQDKEAVKKLTIQAYQAAASNNQPLIIYPASEALANKVYIPKLKEVMESPEMSSAKLIRAKDKDGNTFFVIQPASSTSGATNERINTTTDSTVPTAPIGDINPYFRTQAEVGPNSFNNNCEPCMLEIHQRLGGSGRWAPNRGVATTHTELQEKLLQLPVGTNVQLTQGDKIVKPGSGRIEVSPRHFFNAQVSLDSTGNKVVVYYDGQQNLVGSDLSKMLQQSNYGGTSFRMNYD